MTKEKIRIMNNKELVQVISQEDFPSRMEAFCSEKQQLPLAVFYNSFVTEHYDPRKTVADVSARVFGRPGLVKKITYDERFFKDMDDQIAYLKALPQQLIQICSSIYYNGYDHVMLFAERLVQSSGKHVVAMVPEKNSIIEDSLGSRIIYYTDPASEALLTWRGRVEVWQADRPCCYCQTRQVYLACLKAGVLDMLKTWSEEGRREDILKATEDPGWLNETYRQYVCSRKDVPYLLKYATFDERLLVDEIETEYGKVTHIKAENMEGTRSIEYSCLNTPWRRNTKELKLTL